MLAVTKTSLPETSNGAARALVMRSARPSASSSSTTASAMITNSSPPKRATVSPGRSTARSRPAAAHSRVSPAACPRLSLTILKWSRSTKSTATPLRVRCARATSSRSTSSVRLGSPVSGSCRAWWVSRSWARSRSTTRPSCVPIWPMTSHRAWSNSCGSLVKNSSTAVTSLPTSTGKAKAAARPLSRAALRRGKLSSVVTSVIHAGARVASTRPGSPVPEMNGVAVVASRKAVSRSSSGCTQMLDGVSACPSRSIR